MTQEEIDNIKHIEELAERLNNEEEIDGEFEIPCQALCTFEDEEGDEIR